MFEFAQRRSPHRSMTSISRTFRRPLRRNDEIALRRNQELALGADPERTQRTKGAYLGKSTGLRRRYRRRRAEVNRPPDRRRRRESGTRQGDCRLESTRNHSRYQHPGTCRNERESRHLKRQCGRVRNTYLMLENLFAKLAGKWVAKKADLQEVT